MQEQAHLFAQTILRLKILREYLILKKGHEKDFFLAKYNQGNYFVSLLPLRFYKPKNFTLVELYAGKQRRNLN